ncbi:zinc transport system substrate-binding protein [Devosia enhydra]|uniref:High-affinity zinc uptake system protein ZnuA n=1 Tax=Devosia enhydra TaxID=665118 RepID=A0A1K2HYV7_9HYPH|nr:zinc ABC transporter substrate-binding protein [Devosia enhydra]SFZ84206.1 zinc transport system substrate-binding protein [Devosia enhydra]
MPSLPRLALAFTLGLSAPSLALAAPDVVATTKPIHSLVAMVMGDVGTPRLLVGGSNSPHTYALRPSDAGALEAADMVVWTGPGMELFLTQALETLAIDADVVTLSETPGLSLLPVREGGAFEAHGHGEGEGHDHEAESHDGHDHEEEGHDHEGHDHEGHDHAGHDDEAFDMHYWLDPENARLMVGEIARRLSAADPENAAAYAANAEAADAALAGLTAEITASLAPVSDRPFIVFHDAFHYFEDRFGLTAAGSITVTPDVAPGAQRITELRERIAESGAACVFAEPQFSAAVVNTIIEGTAARTAIVDPEGATLAEGPDLYPQLLRAIAASMSACLAG